MQTRCVGGAPRIVLPEGLWYRPPKNAAGLRKTFGPSNAKPHDRTPMSQRRKSAQKILPDRPATGNAVRRAFVSLFLALLVVAVYAQVANFDFVNFDDPRYVTENPNVKAGLTANGVVWAFSAIYAGNWHPLTWLSHMTDVQLFGLNAGAHHSVNLVLHMANTALLFLLLSSMTGALWRPAFCAALFAVHPLHVESVAWVAERKDVLCGFFWMLTMTSYVGYVRRPSSLRYLATFLSFAAALAAKPMAVTLPLVLWLLDFWPLRRFPDCRVGNQPLPDSAGRRPGKKRSEKVPQEEDPGGAAPAPPAVSGSRIFWEKIPLLVLGLASGLVTLYAQSQAGAVGALQNFPLADRLVNASVAYGKYLIMTVWPVRLSAFYPYVKDLPLHGAAVSLSILAAATFAALHWRRRFPHFTVGWLWYLITLLPVIGIVQVGSQSMADRYTYLPLVGIFIGVCWGIPDLAGRGRNRVRVVAAAACASIAVLSVVSWQQAGFWRNSVSLFSHALAVTTENAVAHGNLATALSLEGREEEALSHYRSAIGIDPSYADAYVNMANSLLAKGLAEEAWECLRKALELRPKDPEVRYNAGTFLARRGRTGEAQFHLREAIRLRPGYAKAHNNLGSVLLLEGRIDEAEIQFREALRIDPAYGTAQKNLNDITVKGK